MIMTPVSGSHTFRAMLSATTFVRKQHLPLGVSTVRFFPLLSSETQKDILQ